MKKAILGRNNTQERKQQRLAMTPDILWILKMKLAKARMPIVKKCLVWAMATFLFIGSLRSGEALPCTKDHFVKNATLLNKHVTLETKQVEGSEVTMLRIFFCLVLAWMKWKEIS